MTTGIFTALAAVLVLILLDTLLGVILSIKAREFDVRKLPQFLATNLLPYGGALLFLGLAACLAGEYSTQLLAIFYAAVAATGAKFLAEAKDKVIQIFGEIQIETGSITVSVDKLNSFNESDINNITKAIIESLQKQTTASK